MMITMTIESCRLTPPHLMDFVVNFFSTAPSFLPAFPAFEDLGIYSRRYNFPYKGQDHVIPKNVL